MDDLKSKMGFKKSDKETTTNNTAGANGAITNGSVYTTKQPEDDESHQMISSLFLGPHAENYDWFKDNLIGVLEKIRDGRLNYFPEDGVSHPDGVQRLIAIKTKNVTYSRDSLAKGSKLQRHLRIPQRRLATQCRKRLRS